MYRCFFISLAVHGMLIVALVILGFLTPRGPIIQPHGPIKVSINSLLPGNGNNGDDRQNSSIVPTPRAVDTPAPTPASTPAPTPAETQPPIVVTPPPAKTPEPQLTAIPKPPPTPAPVVTPPPKVIHTNEEIKKVVQKKEPILESEPTATPTASPKPTERPVAQATATPKAAPTAAPTPREEAAVDPSLLNPPSPRQEPDRGQKGPVQISTGAPGEPGGPGGLGFTYFAQVEMILKSHFKPPYFRSGLTCRVRFTILRDGTITQIANIKSTGNMSLDQYAIKALTDTAKLPPLYDEFPGPSLTVTVTFDYEQK